MPLDIEKIMFKFSQDVAEMKSDLKNIVRDIGDLKNDKSVQLLEERVRKLENYRYWLMGVAAAIGGAVGFIASKL